MGQYWATAVGLAAAGLTTAAFFPQAIKTIRTRDTSGLSVAMYLMMVAGVVLWLAYGVILRDWPLIVANVVVLMPQTAILLILLRQRGR